MVTRSTPVGSARCPASRRELTVHGGAGTSPAPHQHVGATSARRQDDAGAVQGNAPVREKQQAQSGGRHARHLCRRGDGTAMTETQWGRKETIVRPPHYPVYSFGAAFVALAVAGLCVYLDLAFV